jgi:hypothetical protein
VNSVAAAINQTSTKGTCTPATGKDENMNPATASATGLTASSMR